MSDLGILPVAPFTPAPPEFANFMQANAGLAATPQTSVSYFERLLQEHAALLQKVAEKRNQDMAAWIDTVPSLRGKDEDGIEYKAPKPAEVTSPEVRKSFVDTSFELLAVAAARAAQAAPTFVDKIGSTLATTFAPAIAAFKEVSAEVGQAINKEVAAVGREFNRDMGTVAKLWDGLKDTVFSSGRGMQLQPVRVEADGQNPQIAQAARRLDR